MHEEIRTQILEIVKLDQEVRRILTGTLTHTENETWKAIDSSNTLKLQKIIDRIGLPTISKVGEEAARGAWLIIQHADHDVVFQRQCLKLMTDESVEDVPEEDIAYLYDRICVNEDRPQFFGTQFKNNAYGAYGPEPIEILELVDERRRALGLDTLIEYKKRLEKKYA